MKNTIEIFTTRGEYARTFRFNADYQAGRVGHKLVENPLSVRVNLNTMAIVDWKKSVVLFDLEENVRACIDQPGLMSMCMVSDHASPTSLKLFMHSQTGEFVAYRLFETADDENREETPTRFNPQRVFAKKFDELKCSSEFMIYSVSSRVFVLTLGWSKSIAIIRL